MSSKFQKKIVVEKHKRLNRDIQITTIKKKNNTKMKAEDVKKIGLNYVKLNPDKKLMIKALTEDGYITLKGYDENIDKILSDEVYLMGRINAPTGSIYKVSFYLI